MIPRLLVADKKRKIFSHPGMGAVGMDAGIFSAFNADDAVKLPPGSQLFNLPCRTPVGIDPGTKRIVQVDGYSAVAAFISPGYTLTHSSAYREEAACKALPLYSYASCAYYKGAIYVSAVRIDKDVRHDSRYIDMPLVKKNIAKFKKIFKENRLIPHLERCALVYGCPNAQNFFLSRYEAPLPTSPSCNSSCAGCISHQEGSGIRPSQPRIRFVPSPKEVSEIAIFHIENTRDPIVSFGQGCEGEPLLSGAVIGKAIRIIRRNTSKGMININTNASKPDILFGLLDAGLDSIRVSMNSARPIYYNRYYNPCGYTFEDVKRSIKIAKSKGVFVSLNYLTMPGFTDLKEEVSALKKLVRDSRIDMIQWRNLNYDPLLYFRKLKLKVSPQELMGIRATIESLKREFPRLRMGYFNPAVKKGV